jgi:hypothetical protein
MMWAGHVAHTGEDKKVYKVLVGKPDGKKETKGVPLYPKQVLGGGVALTHS